MNLKEAQKAMIDGKKVRAKKFDDTHVEFNGLTFDLVTGDYVRPIIEYFEALKDDEWEVVKEKPKREIKAVFDIIKVTPNSTKDVRVGLESYEEAERVIKEELPNGRYGIDKIYEVSHE